MKTNKIDVKKIREEFGLKQDELAKALGVSRQTISNWERGQEIPETKLEKLRGYKLENNNPSVVSEPETKYEGLTREQHIERQNKYIELLEAELERQKEMNAKLLEEKKDWLKNN